MLRDHESTLMFNGKTALSDFVHKRRKKKLNETELSIILMNG